jgi:hypothetical protein
MGKKWRRFLMGGICGLLLLPQSLLAQPPLKRVSLPSLERLCDQDLQQFCGQNAEQIYPLRDEVAGRIKLWDEWAKPQQPGSATSLATSGKNQVILFPPQR